MRIGTAAARSTRLLRLAATGARGKDRRHRLASQLGSLHGLPEKIGQLLALGELDHADRAFQALTHGSHALGREEACIALEAALGRPISTVFSNLNFDGIAASLGQVHRGRLYDGREVAVKLQYPGIAEAVKVDLAALGLIGNAYRRGYDLRAYRAQLGEMISRELDYRLEAQSQTQFRTLASAELGALVVPGVVAELSTDRLLVMDWLDGAPLQDMGARPRPVREAAARALIRFFFKSVLQWRLVHGDLQPGNLRFIERGEGDCALGVLDFGCVQALEPSMAAGLRLLFEGAVSAPEAPAAHWLARYEAVGFSRTLLEPLADQLAATTRLILAPLLEGDEFSVADWNLNVRFKALLGEQRFAFRFAAPASFLFTVRAFVGLVQVLKALNAPVRWRTLCEEVLAQSTLPPSPALQLRSTHSEGGLPSKALRVVVARRDGTRVSLAFNARAVDDLPALVPPEVMPRLLARRIDLDAIAAQAVARGYAPSELFALEEPACRVRVWLE
jgi:predicted unusual protein kinase regulating ubiquinone biosynthesis (AarF/ABC1/UbiB family)